MNHKHNENNSQNNTTLLLLIIIGLLIILIALGAFYMGKNMNNSQMNNLNVLSTGNQPKSQSLIVKVISDKRCSDCQTDNLITNLKKVPGLQGSEFTILDFSDDGISEYLKNNNIKALPAVIFQTNFVSPGINQSLKAINNTEFSLDLGANAKFNPFEKRSERGLLQLDLQKLKKIKEDIYTSGNTDAKITWLEYSDLECPFCAKLHNSSTPNDINTKYGDTINYVFKNFPLGFHKNASKESEAILCAGELGGSDIYYSYIKTIFNRTTSNGTGFALDKLTPLAVELGLNKTKFQTCLDSGKYATKVKNESTEGANIFGITGTPGNVLINNTTGEYEILSGAYPTEQFKAIIDKLLSK